MLNTLLKYFLIFIFVTQVFNDSSAQFSGARDYLNSPKNIFVINPTYYYYSGNKPKHPDLTNEQTNNSNAYSIDFYYYFSFFGNIANIQAYAGYEAISSAGDATIVTADTSVVVSADRRVKGVTDLACIFTANIFGAPAMNLKALNKFKPKSNLSGRLFITAPIGSYEKSYYTNIGGNKWTFTPEIAFTQPFGENFYLALYGNTRFSTNDTEFLDTNNLVQNPVWGAAVHPSYTFIPSLGFWASLDAIFSFSGTSYINGIDQDSESNTLMLGGTIASNINEAQAVSLQYLNTISLERNGPRIWQLFLNYSYTFF